MSPREDEARVAAKAPERECQDRCCRPVKPLQVVERHHDRSISQSRREGAPGSAICQARVDLAVPPTRAVRPSAEIEQVPLPVRQGRPIFVNDRAEKIAQRRQAHFQFCLRAHCAQDTTARPLSNPDCVLEQACLADPGIALDDQPPRLRSDRANEPLDRLELSLSTADQRLFG